MKIILASASKRRQELLKILIENFSIIESNFDEDKIIFKDDPIQYVKEVSKGKCLNVVSKLKNSKDNIIISCDTIVFCKGKVLGKPKSKEAAFQMLQRLSGSIHEVYSGFTIYNTKTKQIVEDYYCTKVEFMELSSNEIERYIETGDYFDKAGGYGIQSGASKFVKNIEGCYFNVVGLPLNKLYVSLRDMGVILN